jgi:hypothetical protein
MDVRRLVLRGTPVAFGVVSLLHPVPGSRPIVEALEPDLRRWLVVHVAQLALLALLAATLWLLVDGLSSGAATVCRVALVPFLAFYSAFDAVVGIGTGTLVGLARGLDGDARTTAVRLAQAFWDARLSQGAAIFAVIAAAHLAWLVAVGAAVVALRQAGASRTIVALLALAGALFAVGHPWPTGTAAMACLGAVTWIRTSRSA